MASVIFDLDGTLVDSMPDIHAAVNRLLAHEGQAEMDRATVQSFVGDGVPKLVQRVMAARDMAATEFDRLEDLILTDYEARAAELSALYPGVRAALLALQDEGVRLGVCTNKPRGPALHLLGEMGLTGFFEVVIGGDSTAQKKPHPMPLTSVMSAMNSKSALFVGDSEIDAGAAAAANVDFALFTEGYMKIEPEEIPHRFRFDHFDSLPEIVRRALF